VVVAPARGRRPGAARGTIAPPTAEELEECPFCAGHEERTPPETLRLPEGGDDWTVRVVPNLYRALERQEVVVHTPRHVRSFAELEKHEIDLVAEAWRRRREAVPEGYVHAFVNEGREAGASLAHSHSQLAWLAETPPAAAAESGEVDVGEVVLERNGLTLGCPPGSRLPYELIIAPQGDEPDGLRSERLAAALHLLAEAIRRLQRLEGAVPWNAWLHDGRRWHIEVVPRLAVLAGLELGAGIYVNSLPPEQAAAALRDA
jgi:UDPglucose--hexose-1-phosphate uridylyltransferase